MRIVVLIATVITVRESIINWCDGWNCCSTEEYSFVPDILGGEMTIDAM